MNSNWLASVVNKLSASFLDTLGFFNIFLKYAAILNIKLRKVKRHEEPPYKALMSSHHYLADLPKIGETIWVWLF